MKKLGQPLQNEKGNVVESLKTLARNDKMLLRLSIADPKKTSSDLKRDMVDYGVHLSTSFIQKRLVEAGRTARKPKAKQLLTQKMKSKRLAWAITNTKT